MRCICLPKVAAMNVAVQSASFPAVAMPPLPAGAGDLAAMASAAAAINAVAQAALSGALDAVLNAEFPPVSIEAVLALEAMAQASSDLGLNLTAPNAEAQLSLAAGSLNIAAPTLSGLGESSAAAVAPTGNLPAALALGGSIQQSLGIDLAAPSLSPGEIAAAIEASFAAAIEAAASLTASVAGTVSLEMATQIALAARAVNAAVALGMDISSPGEFAATIEATAGLSVPPLELSQGEMGEISAGLSDFALVSEASGGGEASMPSLDATAANVSAAISAAIEATASFSAELMASAEVTAMLAAAISASAELSAGAGAAASVVAEISPPAIPGMDSLSLAGSMAGTFEAAAETPMIGDVSCPNIFCVAGQ
ncbi:hypothetical protein LOC67_11245 [Stieleria sp. JC731]|uniref:hypothetical protein n=1 Tax=Pirellulaceae TaxID=2691357 RepID=UPI001E3818DF|nr:hypothetical protein [Stieleria sp. JC731]MCC9601123.1 hypothetical protein [Stieleria sp. JC731]